MTHRITVDHPAVMSAATEVEAMATSVATCRGALAGPLVSAEAHLAGSSTSDQLTALSEAVLDVHADLATALGGLAYGLEAVVLAFTEVDVVAADEAQSWWLGS